MNFTYKQPYVTWKGPSTGSAVPTWSRPLINNNANANAGTSFAARPIKHWRKQLIPLANTGISKNAGVGMPMDRPGGSVYLGSIVDCSNCLVNITEMTPTTKNIMFDNTNDSSGNCIACNPETNIIKSGITLLNKIYYTDTKSYLQSQCQTYDQKLSTIPIPGNSYINPTTHQPIPSSDSLTGSQVYYTENCSKKCADVNSVVRTIYKPNNQQYSQQGSVSSSSRLTRLKYNTITKNGNSFKTAWGQQGANAGRYHGTSDAPYFLKSKNQECVPVHRDGNKTTNCVLHVPLHVPVCGEVIDISTIATNAGGNNWAVIENKTIEKCQILTIDNGITLNISTNIILTVKGIINNNGIIVNNFNNVINTIGTIDNNSGIINNKAGGIITNNNYGIINNNAGGIINNNTGAIITNKSDSKITNNAGGIINNAGGIITNDVGTSGTIINNASGRINNTAGGTINNNYIISNKSDGIIANYYGGIINNNSTFFNSGNVYNPLTNVGCGVGTYNGTILINPIINACPP